ncbi:hypothetical protein PVIIG_00829 [Plasmodium vivax India VII]|uniref:Variable surface protein Vir7-like protein n=2 Tax=Plasmodium vivax TaxID=5855 RepID=A0A0J9TIQ2_PLAVI|nr:hypothetical protein PVIIG_00829 [Plasmodium vivax India VII]KMZ94936.1 hypothetical protein PVMG_06052 [Plasmodium vivax Mauritania I]
MGEFLGKSKLDHFNTIVNYNSFDKDKENCAYYPHIIAEKHQLYGKIWKKDISDQLLNALCYVYKGKDNDTLDKNLCNYLYYWLGSKVLTNLRHKHFFFDVINTIYHILNKGYLGKVCEPAEYNIYYYNFYKSKEVYDLSEDYNTYESLFIKPNPSCDKDYQDELKSYLYFYKKLRNECIIEQTNYHDQYCKIFNDYFTEKKDKVISSWICKLKESEEQDKELEEEPMEDAENELLPEKPEIIVGQKLYRQGLLETGEFPEYLSALGTGVLAKNTVMGSFSDPTDNSSPSTMKKSITSAVSAAGVLVPPFLVYHVITIVIAQHVFLFYI